MGLGEIFKKRFGKKPVAPPPPPMALPAPPKTWKELMTKEGLIDLYEFAKAHAKEYSQVAKARATEYSQIAKARAAEYSQVAKVHGTKYYELAKEDPKIVAALVVAVLLLLFLLWRRPAKVAVKDAPLDVKEEPAVKAPVAPVPKEPVPTPAPVAPAPVAAAPVPKEPVKEAPAVAAPVVAAPVAAAPAPVAAAPTKAPVVEEQQQNFEELYDDEDDLDERGSIADTIADVNDLPDVKLPMQPSMPSLMEHEEKELLPDQGPPLAVCSAAGAIGKRVNMEDTFAVLCCTSKVAAGAIFDGAGGSKAAEAASRSVRDFFDDMPCDADGLKTALERAEKSVIAQAARNGKWPDATTAVLGLADEKKIHVAWVGDSVAYVVSKGGNFKRLTVDHCAANPAEATRIKAAGGKVGRSPAEAKAGKARKMFSKVAGPTAAYKTNKKNPMRVYPGGITLTRVIGGLPLKYTKPQCIVPTPEAVTYVRQSEDLCVLLASDGLLEKLDTKTVAKLLTDSKFTKQDAATALVDAAQNADTTDNIAACVLFF